MQAQKPFGNNKNESSTKGESTEEKKQSPFTSKPTFGAPTGNLFANNPKPAQTSLFQPNQTKPTSTFNTPPNKNMPFGDQNQPAKSGLFG